MPSHWDKSGDQYTVPTKFDMLKSVGPVDAQVNAIRDFIVAYNSSDADFSLSLEDGGSGGEGDDESGGNEEAGGDEEAASGDDEEEEEDE